ncbi:MAG: adenylate/guanylate cyclase domain-containing protein [Sulfurospirillaceae bacterium]|nr:adenylate/guanylate cyclase domain-containing protein [Sulfurospirillaceae bacterium]
MRKYQQLFIESFIALALFAGASYMYINEVAIFSNINKKLTDLFFHIRGFEPASQDIVIVDIDEKSLRQLGQWPWSRDTVATLLNNMTQAQVGVIGLDIVFAESDNSSPKKVFQKLKMPYEKAIDYDEILANTFATTPTISGYTFDFETTTKRGDVPNIPAIIIEKDKENNDFLPQAKGIIANIPLLQNASYSSGFFNTIPDEDGIVRSVPLLISYENQTFPSLSLEILRAITGAKKIVVNYTSVGVDSIVLGDIVIPTDRFGRLLVNYRGYAKSYTYLSAVDVYKNNFDKSVLEGKVAIIGTSASGLLDLRATPYENIYPGVEVHATAIDNVLNQDFIHKPAWVESADLALLLTLIIIITLASYLAGPILSAFITICCIYGFLHYAYSLLLSKGILLNIIYPFVSAILLYLFLTLIHYIAESKQKELIKAKFAKKVSKAVADSLIKQGDKGILEGKEREITIFFSDIRGFTSISEKIGSPKKLIDFLNQYMTPMSDIIIKKEGTIDKFIGDAIMAYWNAPLDVPEHANKALDVSIEQFKKLEELNKIFAKQNLPAIDIGIGLNSGMAVVGEMGSEGRSDYTVIGDTINLGSRLESLCKQYGAKIILSQYTKQKLKEPSRYIFRELDCVRVKGKQEPIFIYECLGTKDFELVKFDEKELYEEALGAYKRGDFALAFESFKTLANTYKAKLYTLYMERCEHYLKSPPTDFDGVFTFTTK